MSPTEPKGLNRKETLKALSRAVQVYWEHEKAQPIPDHLAQLAAKVDEALARRTTTPSIVPAPAGEREAPVNITQVKDID